MDIKIRGAKENNLKSVDIDIGDGLTVVTGISGSGKTSLVFDTLYHEARRRFLDIFRSSSSRVRMPPANVRSLTGIGPTIAVGQNLLNLNPNSTLASASGLHPFFRLLYSRFGTRSCLSCGANLQVLTEDEIVAVIKQKMKKDDVSVTSALIRQTKGSHRTLLELLVTEFGLERVLVDGAAWKKKQLKSDVPHDISIRMGTFTADTKTSQLREAVQTTKALGSNSIAIRDSNSIIVVSMSSVCAQCGSWYGAVEPKHFGMKCIHCGGKTCEKCNYTGLHQKAASVRWKGKSLPELMSLSVAEAYQLFKDVELPSTAKR
ncbi:hypothetical protein EU528_14100, partial [Candidatus Thorarchaeota archaeon]